MVIDPILPWPVVALIASALLGFSAWTYSPVQGTRRWMLGLRILSILLVTAVMLRPSLVFTREEKLSSTLVIMADKSKSMQLKDEAADRTRAAAVDFDLQNSRDAFARLKEEVRLRWFEFDDEAVETDQEKVLQRANDGDRTALGDSLLQVHRQLAGQRLARIVLLSDGANTTGVSPSSVAQQLRSLRVPVETFGYGQELVGAEARDLVARDIRVNPVAFAKNKLPVTGDFDIRGYGGERVDVRLLFNDVEQARGSFTTKEEARQLLAELQAVPMIPGDLKVTIEATTAGDRQTGNNAVSTWVTVLAGGINVLAIEGKYRYWEPKFLRWALDQSPDIELSQLFLLEGGNARATVPQGLLEPGKFDVVILGDIAASHFDPTTIHQLVDLVTNRGVGLAMIGGYDAFGPGGWQQTELASILPIEMKPGDPQRTEPIVMTPSEAGLRHFILRLSPDPQKNNEAWRALRPLDGASSWSGLKPAAQVLAQAGDKSPMLVAQAVGAGRTIAFAADTTWRWRRGTEGIERHAKFWRQMILWLAKKEETGSAQIKLQLPTRRVPIGQALPFTVQIEEADGKPIANAVLTAEAELPNGEKMPLDLTRDTDDWRGAFWKAGVVGDFTLRVSAKAGERDFGTIQRKFLVYSEDLEAQQPAADFGSLKMLAEATGGKFHPSLELPDYLRNLETEDLNLSIPAPVVERLWDRWETLLLFLLLVTAEWIVRKRAGLV